MASRGRRWRRRAARPRRARTAWGARALLLLLQQQEAKKARMQKIQLTAASANGTGPMGATIVGALNWKGGMETTRACGCARAFMFMEGGRACEEVGGGGVEEDDER